MKKYKMNRLFSAAIIMMIVSLVFAAAALVLAGVLNKQLTAVGAGIAGTFFAALGLIFAMKSKPKVKTVDEITVETAESPSGESVEQSES